MRALPRHPPIFPTADKNDAGLERLRKAKAPCGQRAQARLASLKRNAEQTYSKGWPGPPQCLALLSSLGEHVSVVEATLHLRTQTAFQQLTSLYGLRKTAPLNVLGAAHPPGAHSYVLANGQMTACQERWILS